MNSEKPAVDQTSTAPASDDNVNTPYDDTFRTMAVDCRQLLIPLVNEVFGKKYTGNEEILPHPNEHFLNRQDGQEDKRITDSSFTIIGDSRDKYIIECQSMPDSSMTVRIYQSESPQRFSASCAAALAAFLCATLRSAGGSISDAGV